MREDEVRAFLVGQKLHVFDPGTRTRFAEVHYDTDSRCRATFEDGRADFGTYGIEGDMYWTRYSRFRDGATCHFYLVRLGPSLAQAYHADGIIAFLQSSRPHLETVPGSDLV